MKRTYEQFICLLKRYGATEEQFRRNLPQSWEFPHGCSYYRVLDRAFEWHTTPEEETFWREIAYKLHEWDRDHDERD